MDEVSRGLFSRMMFEMPRVRRFILNITNELINRRNVILFLPRTLDFELFNQELSNSLELRRDLYRVYIPEIKRSFTLANSLGEKLGIDWPKACPRIIENLIEAKGLPEVILLEGANKLSVEDSKLWLEFVNEWSQVSIHTTNIDKQATVLCLLAPLPIGIKEECLENSLSLAVKFWIDLPSTLEVKLLLNMLLEVNYDDNYISLLWKENIIPTLVGEDLELAELLWCKNALNSNELLKVIKEYAINLGWDKTSLIALGIKYSIVAELKRERINTLSHSSRVKILWSEGLINFSGLNGVELHIGAIAALDWKEEFMHRLWRGQAQFLLPMIDTLRLHLCDKLAREYGRDWSYKIEEPLDEEQKTRVKETPLACEWGHMQQLLTRYNYFRGCRKYLPLIRLARNIRNELAHNKPIDFIEFSSFYKEYQTKIK